MKKLCDASLPGLNGPCLPNYNRGETQPGILHIGLGNFHRAHQAVYVDDLLNLGGFREWGIISSIIRSEQNNLLLETKRQDGLYTLLTVSPSNERKARVIGSMTDVVDGVNKPLELVSKIADASIKIVMFTVTEGGYYLSTEGDCLLSRHPDIQADLNGGYRTIYSFLLQGLKRRMESNSAPLTLLSCDNLRLNGKVLRKGLKDFLELSGERKLLDWCEKNLTFPNSMVDRITPKSDPALSEELAGKYGYEDKTALMAEEYIQWVLEDDFIAGRPPWEKVGVEIVSDIYEKEESKIRILNGGHCAVAWFAALRGYSLFHEAMGDPVLNRFLDEYILNEALPTLDFVTFDLRGYYAAIKERFGNPHIPDTIERLAAEGASRLPGFVLPVVFDLMDGGKNCVYGFNILAAWFEALEKERRGTLHFSHYEQERDLVRNWLSATDPFEAFIGDADFWGYGTRREQRFKSEMRSAKARLIQKNFSPLSVE